MTHCIQVTKDNYEKVVSILENRGYKSDEPWNSDHKSKVLEMFPTDSWIVFRDDVTRYAIHSHHGASHNKEWTVESIEQLPYLPGRAIEVLRDLFGTACSHWFNMSGVTKDDAFARYLKGPLEKLLEKVGPVCNTVNDPPSDAVNEDVPLTGPTKDVVEAAPKKSKKRKHYVVSLVYSNGTLHSELSWSISKKKAQKSVMEEVDRYYPELRGMDIVNSTVLRIK